MASTTAPVATMVPTTTTAPTAYNTHPEAMDDELLAVDNLCSIDEEK